MLNHVVLMGRLTADVELRTTQSGTSVASFTVAVDRGYGEEKKTDFINCVAWKGTAEFISNYFNKGRMIAAEGSIQVRNYEDKNGKKVYVTEVIVTNASFCGDKAENRPVDNVPPTNEEFTIIPDEEVTEGDDLEGLPF